MRKSRSVRIYLFSALVRLPVHSFTSRGHSHGHSHSFCSILRRKTGEKNKERYKSHFKTRILIPDYKWIKWIMWVEKKWWKTHLWQFKQRRSTVLQAQKARESHVSFTMPANALVPGIRVSLYFEQWLPWTRFVRSPWKITQQSHYVKHQHKHTGFLNTHQSQPKINMTHTSAKYYYTANMFLYNTGQKTPV